MKYYNEIKRIVLEQFHDTVIVYETNEVLTMDIPVGSRKVTITLQGLDIPELDLQFGKVKRYYSSGNTEDMVRYVNKVLQDIRALREFKERIEFKQNRTLGVFGGKWTVANPGGLIVLGRGKG